MRDYVSYSELTTFLRCRRAHFLRYGLNLQRVPFDGVTTAADRGRAVHEAVSALHRGQNPDVLNDKDTHAMLRRYIDRFVPGTSLDDFKDMDAEVELFAPWLGVTWRAFVDGSVIDYDGSTAKVERILELKTSSRPDIERVAYIDWQLTLYAALYREVFGAAPAVHLRMVSKKSAGEILVWPTDDQISLLAGWVNGPLESLMAERESEPLPKEAVATVPPTPHWSCATCEFREICVAAGAGEPPSWDEYVEKEEFRGN